MAVQGKERHNKPVLHALDDAPCALSATRPLLLCRKLLHLTKKCLFMLAKLLVTDGHIRLLDLYLQKVPPEAVENDVFYVRPLDNIPSDPTAPWHTSVPVS